MVGRMSGSPFIQGLSCIFLFILGCIALIVTWIVTAKALGNFFKPKKAKKSAASIPSANQAGVSSQHPGLSAVSSTPTASVSPSSAENPTKAAEKVSDSSGHRSAAALKCSCCNKIFLDKPVEIDHLLYCSGCAERITRPGSGRVCSCCNRPLPGNTWIFADGIYYCQKCFNRTFSLQE